MLREINKSPGHQVTRSPVKDIAFAVLSAVEAALPFLDGRLWLFAWFGFVPFFLALRDKPPLRAFLLSYLCGLVFWSITIYWLIHVTLLGQILLILYLALYFGLFGLFAISYQLSAISLFFLPSLWVLLEYLRSHFLTGFGWALLGYSQYLNLPIIQIADLFGTYGVSFLVMGANVMIYRLIVPGHGSGSAEKEIKYAAIMAICIFIALGYGYFKLYDRGQGTGDRRQQLRLSVIQGNIPQELKWAPGSEGFILNRYLRLTEEAAQDRPELIIWPEASVPGFLGQDEPVFQAVFDKVKNIGIPLLSGTVVRQDGKYYNSALLIGKEGEISARYDKLHLVPFGEYIPLKNTFKFLETIVPIGDFTAGREYTLFQLSAINHQSLTRFGVLICFEDTIPELSRNFANKGADFLVNITNDGWFGNTSAPYQHLAASVFRAIESRIPLARSANTGVSCFIDPRGRIISAVREGAKQSFIHGFQSENVIIDKGKSLYRGIGDLFILGCLALVVFYGIIKNSKIKTQKSEPRN